MLHNSKQFLALPFHRVATQSVSPPSRCRSNRCYAFAVPTAAVPCEAAQRKTSPCLFIAPLNSAPPFHGYSLLNQSVALLDCAIHFHCFSTVFSTVLCRRYDYQGATLPLQCHAMPLNSIPFQCITPRHVAFPLQRQAPLHTVPMRCTA